MQWQLLVKNLIDQINIDNCIASSYKDYHAKGIDYVNLLRTPQLTVKVLSIDSKIEALNKHHKTVLNPHTHRYNSLVVLLKGSLEQVKFKFFPRAVPNTEPKPFNEGFSVHNRFDYKSPLIALTESKYRDSGHLVQLEEVALKNLGENVYVEKNDITSFRSFGETMILVLQYRSVAEEFTNFFTQSSTLPVTTGLYTKHTRSEILNLINNIDEFVSNYIHSETITT